MGKQYIMAEILSTGDVPERGMVVLKTTLKFEKIQVTEDGYTLLVLNYDSYDKFIRSDENLAAVYGTPAPVVAPVVIDPLEAMLGSMSQKKTNVVDNRLPQPEPDIYVVDEVGRKDTPFEEMQYNEMPSQTEVSSTLQDFINKTGLKVEDDMEEMPGVFINDDAGVDGSNITREEAAMYCQIMGDMNIKPVTRQSAFDRLKGIPLAKLMFIANEIPIDVRKAITMHRVGKMPSGRQGLGKNHVPLSWSEFVQNDSQFSGDVQANTGRFQVAQPMVVIKDQNLARNAAEYASYSKRQRNVSMAVTQTAKSNLSGINVS